MRSREFSLVLTIFFGWFGAQAFYKGEIYRGMFSLLLFWTFVPAVISVFEFVWDLASTPQDWDMQYNKENQ